MAVLCLLLIHEYGKGARYKYGMTIKEILRMTEGRYPVNKYGIIYDERPSPRQMSEDAVYYIYDEKNGILLSFNHHEILVVKKRIKLCGVNVYRLMDAVRSLW